MSEAISKYPKVSKPWRVVGTSSIETHDGEMFVTIHGGNFVNEWTLQMICDGVNFLARSWLPETPVETKVEHEIGGAGHPCPCKGHPYHCFNHPHDCGCQSKTETVPEHHHQWVEACAGTSVAYFTCATCGAFFDGSPKKTKGDAT